MAGNIWILSFGTGGMLPRRVVVLGLVVALGAAGLPRRARHRATQVTQRRRLHADSVITAAGTAEVDWGHQFAGSFYSMPSTLKFTPAGSFALWRNTEYSAHVEGITSVAANGRRVTQLADRVTAAASRLVYDDEKLAVVVAPQGTISWRNGPGARVGASVLGRYDFGSNSVGGNLAWTGATSAAATNPAGAWEWGGGYARRAGRWTLFGNLVWDRATTGDRLASVLEGVNCDLRENWTLDVGAQHFHTAGGGTDHQLLVGLTINLGRPGEWFHRTR